MGNGKMGNGGRGTVHHLRSDHWGESDGTVRTSMLKKRKNPWVPGKKAMKTKDLHAVDEVSWSERRYAGRDSGVCQ